MFRKVGNLSHIFMDLVNQKLELARQLKAPRDAENYYDRYAITRNRRYGMLSEERNG